MDTPLLALVRRYFAAIESEAPEATLREFFAPEVRQEEFPNRLVPQGVVRDLEALMEGSRRGRAVVGDQRYEIVQAVEQGDRIALEVKWRARLKVPIGSLPAGGEMRARFGVFIDFRDGRIVGQRNYDCFEPF